jgi:uncharacterized glyoxalase superfamily protein PhnB
LTKTNLTPHINLKGKARHAMEHYHEALGGKFELRGQA